MFKSTKIYDQSDSFMNETKEIKKKRTLREIERELKQGTNSAIKNQEHDLK